MHTVTQYRLAIFALLLGGIVLFAARLLAVPERDMVQTDVPLLLADASELDRGAYLVTAGNCASCHTTAGGELMAGGLRFETPFGAIYSTNITPDPLYGIGSWSFDQFLQAMRYGRRPNGEHLYPAFPYTAYTRLSERDLRAMYAYLQTIGAVAVPPPENELSFPFNQRALLAFWKMLYFSAGERPPDPTKSMDWIRGEYLVEGLAHCSACHTPRNFLGAEDPALAYAGGTLTDLVELDKYREWSAPDLSSSHSGLGAWKAEDLVAYLHTARNRFLESFGPMNEVIMNSTRYLERKDVVAMAEYLKSIPSSKREISIDRESGGDHSGPAFDADVVMGRGRTVYNLHCGTCHLPTGAGDPEMGPRLNRGSLIVLDDNPASMINAILYGPQAPYPPLPEKWRHPMGEFQYELSDEEIAAVATYVRNSWDNRASPVSVEQVAAQR
ncbi:MAG: cytochrome c [Pseudomonadota bacterium]